jgi:signal transduction histidine kinase
VNVIKLAGSLVLPCLMAWAQVPTQAQAKALVGQAVAFAKQNGVEKLIQETNQATGRFHVAAGSELYLFVFDQAGTCRAIGSDTEALVGRNLMSARGPDGKFYIREIVRVAKTNGKGWVDYQYPNPRTGRVEHKISYVQWYKDLVLGAGVYK